MATKDLPSLENGIQTGDVTWAEWQGQGSAAGVLQTPGFVQ